MCKTDSTQQALEVKPLITRPNERIAPAHAAFIDRLRATHLLNATFRALLGINAVADVLAAHSVGRESGEPIVGNNIEGGLLDAIVCLSSYAAGEIESFADSVDDQYDSLCKSEVSRG
ncbi:hypothetical protein ACVCIH_09570 [Burkholderia glumae]|uniref:hypothetical protein n=1 Tax=Burkholderia glumae TaxID=337 RepID=UPI0020371A07|nr:hypothetical protein [Burkholderia glumae]MCM2493058.1 hypothetical protein [Burkholderia glumae]